MRKCVGMWYGCTYAYVCVYICVRVRVCVCTFMYMCVDVYTYTHMCNTCINPYIYITQAYLTHVTGISNPSSGATTKFRCCTSSSIVADWAYGCVCTKFALVTIVAALLVNAYDNSSGGGGSCISWAAHWDSSILKCWSVSCILSVSWSVKFSN